MATRHHDYGTEPLPKLEPDSPHPKPIIPPGPPHAGACRYPYEIGWVQTAMEPWQKEVLPAAAWTKSTRSWLLALGGVILAGLVTLGLSLGATCRAAGANEERLGRVERDQIVDRAEGRAMDKQIEDEQTARYEKIFDLLVKVHSDVQVLKAQADEEPRARNFSSRSGSQ